MIRYKFIQKLGDGSQGVAYHAVEKATNKDVVIKKLPINSRSSDEMKMALELRHPNIINCFDAFQEGDYNFIVLTYAEGGDLDSHMRGLQEKNQRLSEVTMSEWFGQLCSAVDCCHQKHLLHRDIKPSNVFLDKTLKTVYLGDFGVAKRLEGKSATAKTFVGSPVWLSPEVISGEPYSYKSDAWGLGCVLYEMVTGVSPFDSASNFAALVVKISTGDFSPLPPSTPSHIKNAVEGLLTVNVNDRWSIKQAWESSDKFRPEKRNDDLSLSSWVREKNLEIEGFNQKVGSPKVSSPKVVQPKNDPVQSLQSWVREKNREIDTLESHLAKLKPKAPDAPLQCDPTPAQFSSRPSSKNVDMSAARAKHHLVLAPVSQQQEALASPPPQDAARGEREEKMQNEKIKKEEKREREWKEFQLRMREGRKELKHNNNVQNVIVVANDRKEAPQEKAPTDPPKQNIEVPKTQPTRPEETDDKERDRVSANAEKRLRERQQMMADINKQRGAAKSGQNVSVEIVLPSNLRNLPQNKY